MVIGLVPGLRWVGIGSGCNDSPRAVRSGHRIPVGARFAASVQSGPGAHVTCTIGTGSLSPGV